MVNVIKKIDPKINIYKIPNIINMSLGKPKNDIFMFRLVLELELNKMEFGPSLLFLYSVISNSIIEINFL